MTTQVDQNNDSLNNTIKALLNARIDAKGDKASTL